jgi:hypothetical protein
MESHKRQNTVVLNIFLHSRTSYVYMVDTKNQFLNFNSIQRMIQSAESGCFLINAPILQYSITPIF